MATKVAGEDKVLGEKIILFSLFGSGLSGLGIRN
jgi:hypothetical protein